MREEEKKEGKNVDLRVVQAEGLRKLAKMAELAGFAQQLDEKVLAKLDPRGVSMLELAESRLASKWLGLPYHRVRALVKVEGSELPELTVIDVLASDWDELLTPSQFSERLERLRRAALGLGGE